MFLQKKKKTNKKEGLKSEKPDTETDGNNADSKFEPTSKLQVMKRIYTVN